MPYKLRLEPDFSDYIIFGLSTHMKDYKLCWTIDAALQTKLVRYADLVVDGDPIRNYKLFIHKEVSESINIYLLSNYDQHIPWFDKAKHFHYFFIIGGNPLLSQIQYFEDHLRNISQMLLLTKLSPGEKKLAIPLLTEFELHLTETSLKEKEAGKFKIPKRAGIKSVKKDKESDKEEK